MVHEWTKPTESTDGAAPLAVAPVVDAAAPVPSASVKVVRADAGTSSIPSASAVRSSSVKKPAAKLDGFPAGAACVAGQSNGGCASGSECTNGKCTCLNGWTSCGGACRDLSRDPDNCDACGHGCKIGQYCQWGHCEY